MRVRAREKGLGREDALFGIVFCGNQPAVSQ